MALSFISFSITTTCITFPSMQCRQKFFWKEKKEEDLLVRKKTQLINIDWNDEEFIYLCSIWNTEDI